MSQVQRKLSQGLGVRETFLNNDTNRGPRGVLIGEVPQNLRIPQNEKRNLRANVRDRDPLVELGNPSIISYSQQEDQEAFVNGRIKTIKPPDAEQYRNILQTAATEKSFLVSKNKQPPSRKAFLRAQNGYLAEDPSKINDIFYQASKQELINEFSSAFPKKDYIVPPSQVYYSKPPIIDPEIRTLPVHHRQGSCKTCDNNWALNKRHNHQKYNFCMCKNTPPTKMQVNLDQVYDNKPAVYSHLMPGEPTTDELLQNSKIIRYDQDVFTKAYGVFRNFMGWTNDITQ